jgi:hypothetical protein
MLPTPIAKLVECELFSAFAFFAAAAPMRNTLALGAGELNQSFLGFLAHRRLQYQNRGL